MRESSKAVVKQHAAVLRLAMVIGAVRLVHKARMMGSAISTHVGAARATASFTAAQAYVTFKSSLPARGYNCQQFCSEAFVWWHTCSTVIADWFAIGNHDELSLCVAAAVTLPSVAVDTLITDIFSSSPTVLVFIFFKVTQCAAFACCRLLQSCLLDIHLQQLLGTATQVLCSLDQPQRRHSMLLPGEMNTHSLVIPVCDLPQQIFRIACTLAVTCLHVGLTVVFDPQHHTPTFVHAVFLPRHKYICCLRQA